MQIHELNNFAGTPTSSDYLAIDNSTTTTKIGATGLGVQDKLTVAEANTGTSTASRIVTPKVVHDYVVQDTTHITSATKTKWAGITGNDGSINDVADYLADESTVVSTTPTTSTTTGTIKSCTLRKCGHIVEIYLETNNTNNTAAGTNYLVGTITSPYLPTAGSVVSSCFYNAIPLIARLDTDGTLTIRNASGTAFSQSAATISFFQFIYML